MNAHNPNPWVIVTSPGEDNESIWDDYPTYKEARKNLDDAEYNTGEICDIMKRLDDGSLTTDY